MRTEHEVAVTPLTLPAGGDLADVQVLAEAPSVALLLDRARAVAPGFELTDADAGAMAAVCTRLDGLPLALELAAAWLRVLPPAANRGPWHQHAERHLDSVSPAVTSDPHPGDHGQAHRDGHPHLVQE